MRLFSQWLALEVRLLIVYSQERENGATRTQVPQFRKAGYGTHVPSFLNQDTYTCSGVTGDAGRGAMDELSHSWRSANQGREAKPVGACAQNPRGQAGFLGSLEGSWL